MPSARGEGRRKQQRWNDSGETESEGEGGSAERAMERERQSGSQSGRRRKREGSKRWMTLVGGEEGREIATTINTSPRLAPPPIPLKRSFTYPTISSLGQEWNNVLYIYITIIVSLYFFNLRDSSIIKTERKREFSFLRSWFREPTKRVSFRCIFYPDDHLYET